MKEWKQNMNTIKQRKRKLQIEHQSGFMKMGTQKI